MNRPHWVIHIEHKHRMFGSRGTSYQTIRVPWWQLRYLLSAISAARHFYGSQSISVRFYL